MNNTYYLQALIIDITSLLSINFENVHNMFSDVKVNESFVFIESMSLFEIISMYECFIPLDFLLQYVYACVRACVCIKLFFVQVCMSAMQLRLRIQACWYKCEGLFACMC